MKYMQTGGFQNNFLMKLTLGLTLVFISGLWITNLLLFFSKMNLSPQSVVTYYRGSDIEFINPRSFQSMLEVTHFHLPMIAMVVLLLTHLLIFAPFSNRTKIGFIVLAFLSALSNEASSWLVRFIHPHFAILKIVSFLVFEGMVAFLIIALSIFLWKSPTKAIKKNHIHIPHKKD